MDQTELLWALLTTGEISSLSNEWTDGLKKLDLEQIDWSSRNDNGLTILVQSVIILLRNESCEEEMLEIIEKFIRSGASISQTCTDEAESTFNFSRPDDEEEGEECEVSVEPAGLSAIAYVQAWAQELGNAEAAFDQKVQRLGKVLNRFAGGGLKKDHDARVPVHDAIIELWEKYLAASATHDLTIDTADGLVTAHAQMLKGASAVVAAMLESPMQEGQCQRIQVKDVPKGAVSLVLEILYTCSTQNEPDYKTALQAMDVAHRWQVDVVVSVLARLLQGMITDESFSEIAEQAVLKNLDDLKTAIQSFGAASDAVKDQLKDGQLPAAVQKLFAGGTETLADSRSGERAVRATEGQLFGEHEAQNTTNEQTQTMYSLRQELQYRPTSEVPSRRSERSRTELKDRAHSRQMNRAALHRSKSPITIDVTKVQNRFKKAAMTAAAYHLTEEEQKELRRTFEKLDTDGDGFMTLQDLHRGLSDLPQMRGLNLAQLMDDLDRNQDGRLEYTEFIAAAMDQRLHQNEALCWRAFKAFDRDDDDRITYPDLLHVLQDPDLQMEVPNCRSAWQYFARMDEDGDGLVSFEDFMRMLSTQNTPVSASLYTKATFGALSPTRHSVSTMLEEDTVSHEDSAEEVISNGS
ncbi:unnamed protein product [Durusdinium trenchii]|uniref:Calmodulin n=1 Tax=Durusdinium trenchii TaxID=1381693 RepID=A0ABP0SHX5_9DINO